MKANDLKNKNSLLVGLFGKPTSAKSSGLAFSVATLLPTVLSFVFLFALACFGVSEEFQNTDGYLYANFLLPQIAFALVAFFYLRYNNLSLTATVRQQKCKPKYFLVALILQIGLFGLSEVNGLFLEWLQKFGYQDAGISLPSVDGFGFVGVLLVIGVFASVLEEIVFRGVLLNGLKNTFSVPVAVLICGALFALFHQNPAQTIYQFCCGTAFALVAIKAGSVLPTVLAHFVNNTVILILYKAGVTYFPTPIFISIVCVSAFCLIGALWYLLVIDKDKKETEQTENKAEERKNFFLYSSVGIALCTLTWLFVLFSGM